MIVEKIDSDIVAAIKGNEGDKARTLRTLKSALKNKEIELQKPLDDTAAVEVLQKEAKKRNEAIALYKQSGRDDLVGSETAELDIINTYLPEQISDDDLKKIVEEAIAKTGAKEMSDMGKVIGMVMAEAKGNADGARVSALVKEKLTQ